MAKTPVPQGGEENDSYVSGFATRWLTVALFEAHHHRMSLSTLQKKVMEAEEYSASRGQKTERAKKHYAWLEPETTVEDDFVERVPEHFVEQIVEVLVPHAHFEADRGAHGLRCASATAFRRRRGVRRRSHAAGRGEHRRGGPEQEGHHEEYRR